MVEDSKFIMFLNFFLTGNAVTTIKSNDNVKIFTVRGTSFEPAAVDGSGVPQETG